MKLSVSQQSNIFSIALTIIFTILFFVIISFIHFEEKPVYNEIQIDLSTTPVVEDPGQIAENANQEIADFDSNEESFEKVEKLDEVKEIISSEKEIVEEDLQEKIIPIESAPALPKEEMAPEKNESSALLEKNEASVTSPVVEKSVASVEEKEAASIPDAKSTVKQTEKKVKKSAEDIWAEMESSSSSSASSSQSQKVEVKENLSAFEGKAAVASSENAKGLSSQSERTSQKSQSDISKSLDEIKTTKKSKSLSTGDTTSKTSYDDAGSKGSGFNVNGKFRSLIQPSSPSIKLSEASAEMIASTVTVTITFPISASGSVALSQITFSPDAALPPSVKSEIAQQISSWRFSEGESGSALMNYTIVKN